MDLNFQTKENQHHVKYIHSNNNKNIVIIAFVYTILNVDMLKFPTKSANKNGQGHYTCKILERPALQ